jgi:hypothetical protein
LSEPQWEKELAKVEAVSKCAIRLVDAHRVKVKVRVRIRISSSREEKETTRVGDFSVSVYMHLGFND